MSLFFQGGYPRFYNLESDMKNNFVGSVQYLSIPDPLSNKKLVHADFSRVLINGRNVE
jgi:hypothetical protein